MKKDLLKEKQLSMLFGFSYKILYNKNKYD